MTVTIEIPASEPTIRRPQGSPGAIDGVAQAIYVAAGRYEEFGDLAATAKAVPGWYGEAYDAYAGAAGTGVGGARHDGRRRSSGWRTSAAGTPTPCATSSATATSWRTPSCGWTARATNLIADVKAAEDATPEEVAALQDRAQNLRTEYRTLVLDHDALQRKVRANEDLDADRLRGRPRARPRSSRPAAPTTRSRPGRWASPAHRARGHGDRGRRVVEHADRRREGGGHRDVPGRHRLRRRPPGRTPATRPTGSASTATSTCWRARTTTARSRPLEATHARQRPGRGERDAHRGRLPRPDDRRDPRRAAVALRPRRVRRGRPDRRGRRRPGHRRRRGRAGPRHHQRRTATRPR